MKGQGEEKLFILNNERGLCVSIGWLFEGDPGLQKEELFERQHCIVKVCIGKQTWVHLDFGQII